MTYAKAFIAVTAAALFCGNAMSGQPTYKCVSGGKTQYSDEPCPGGTIVDTTPTQGLDKSSGRSRTGADVQRIETNKIFDKALKPLTGKSNAEMEVMRRRAYLTEAAKLQCSILDEQIGDKSTLDSESLFKARVRYREIGC